MYLQLFGEQFWNYTRYSEYQHFDLGLRNGLYEENMKLV